jgi:protein subunit release factor A
LDQLRVRLDHPTPDGAAFAADVCNMLRSVAKRAFISVGSFEPDGRDENDALDLRTTVVGVLGAALTRELGRHRAQRVPPDSATGRVRTVIVSVEFLAASTPARAPTDKLVRTYNYPLRVCTNHETGVQRSLDEVLAGAAG